MGFDEYKNLHQDRMIEWGGLIEEHMNFTIVGSDEAATRLGNQLERALSGWGMEDKPGITFTREGNHFVIDVVSLKNNDHLDHFTRCVGDVRRIVGRNAEAVREVNLGDNTYLQLEEPIGRKK